MFYTTRKLTSLYLDGNKLTEFASSKELTKLALLNLTDNPLTYININSFSSLPRNTELDVSRQEVCACYVLPDINCSASNNRSSYLQCERLLSDKVLVALMWLIGINALGGNSFVLIWRHTKFSDEPTTRYAAEQSSFVRFTYGYLYVDNCIGRFFH